MILPRIRLYKGELPQWILSSALAAYAPRTQTIYLSTWVGPGRLLKNLWHELGHHWIEITGGGRARHLHYDALEHALGIGEEVE